MSTMIIVNLPVKNLAKSTEFFAALGYTKNDQFSDENASNFVISDDIHLMLLVESFYKQFTKKEIADTTKTNEAILALSADSRELVDELVDKALAAGGQPSSDPIDDGFMYVRSFQDLDGHQWEIIWMDMPAMAS